MNDLSYNQKIDCLKEFLEIHKKAEGWIKDPYTLGLINGMIVFMSVLDNIEPEFLDIPEHWENQKKILENSDYRRTNG